MEGFTIRCNRCGDEKVIQSDEDCRKGDIDVFGNWTFEDEFPQVWIVCACGNEV